MSNQSNAPFGYGLIGCGSFGRFCLGEYATMADLTPRAVADAIPEAAQSAGEEFGLPVCPTVEALLERDDVDVVHIATPPMTHRELALAALAAGKHVLCEKPLATTLDDARAMIDAAEANRRILAVNLIMRYDPLCELTRQIISGKLLGEPLHAFLENYAGDEPLSPEHWFWDRKLSGGIFIEHGVHFFDLFEYWFGPGEIVAAQQTVRPNSNDIVEQVHCSVQYGGGVLANHYHGFHQAGRFDRQEFRIVFERGDLRLFEWVPTQMAIECLTDRKTIEAIEALAPNAEVKELATYEGDARQVTSRHRDYSVDGRYRITGDAGMPKQALYGHVVRSLLQDQLDAARNPQHPRRVSERNGLTSLQMAVAADDLARAARPA